MVFCMKKSHFKTILALIDWYFIYQHWYFSPQLTEQFLEKCQAYLSFLVGDNDGHSHFYQDP